MLEDTKHIKISDYDYPLPDERIAKFPLSKRDHSKLLLYKHGEVGEDVFCNLPKSAQLLAGRCTYGVQQHQSYSGTYAL